MQNPLQTQKKKSNLELLPKNKELNPPKIPSKNHSKRTLFAQKSSPPCKRKVLEIFSSRGRQSSAAIARQRSKSEWVQSSCAVPARTIFALHKVFGWVKKHGELRRSKGRMSLVGEDNAS
jgi:uncharacterized Rmd1/YagE family protein